MAFSESARIIITGGSGFVGRHLVRALAHELPSGATLLIADRSAVNLDATICRSVPVDMSSETDVDALIRAERPTHVAHLAAVAAVMQAGREPRDAWNVNFGGSLNLALSVMRHRPECQILFASSAEVYGASFAGGSALDETAAIDPVNAYAATKAAADIMFGQMARQGLKVVRARPFNHTGPGQSEQFVVPAFAAQIARIERGEQEPVIRVGELTSRRDFLDVRDVVDAYVRIFDGFDRLASGTAINIAAGKAISANDILLGLLALASVRIDIARDPGRMRPHDLPIVLGDAARAHALLGWTPRWRWPDTLASVLDYWRALTPRASA
ncbi:MAG: GDP-mannose 4,6-dehydratase [Proteobacteria bacterium]|nr:GDP-mannose 4,6-dehydratase [Pseudomonadota bacterium]